jgi:uncharacterized membrane protein
MRTHVVFVLICGCVFVGIVMAILLFKTGNFFWFGISAFQFVLALFFSTKVVPMTRKHDRIAAIERQWAEDGPMIRS